MQRVGGPTPAFPACCSSARPPGAVVPAGDRRPPQGCHYSIGSGAAERCGARGPGEPLRTSGKRSQGKGRSYDCRTSPGESDPPADHPAAPLPPSRCAPRRDLIRQAASQVMTRPPARRHRLRSHDGGPVTASPLSASEGKRSPRPAGHAGTHPPRTRLPGDHLACPDQASLNLSSEPVRNGKHHGSGNKHR